MVYGEMNQLRRYHHRPDTFLSTTQHFHDDPSLKEAPNGHAHKQSTHAKLYNGSLYFSSSSIQSKPRSWKDGELRSTSDLDRAPPPRQHLTSKSTASGTYRGNGTFTVELPHSTITYKNPSMVPYTQLTWQSEYSDKYIKKKPYSGYSVLSSRWTARPSTTQW